MKKPVSSTRRTVLKIFTGIFPALFFSLLPLTRSAHADKTETKIFSVKLPDPVIDGRISLEYTIQNRRTIRRFSPKGLTLQQLSQLLWAAQGITDDNGFKRAAPSGGALYPSDVYIAAGNHSIKGLDPGVYHYEPLDHAASLILKGDIRAALAKAALGQMWMAVAPLNFIITAEYKRSTVKYGKRGIQYAMIEAGHIGQNIFLQAGALKLRAGIVGAFYTKKVHRVTGIQSAHTPLLIMPVGVKA